MAVRDLEYIADLKRARADLQHWLDLLEAGKLDLGGTTPQAIVAVRHARRAIAKSDAFIGKCGPLKRHEAEIIHLF